MKRKIMILMVLVKLFMTFKRFVSFKLIILERRRFPDFDFVDCKSFHDSQRLKSWEVS